MKRLTIVVGGLMALILVAAGSSSAQHQMGGPMQMGGRMQMGGPPERQEQPSGHHPMMGRGMMGHGMMGHGMMGMMCPMMAFMMDPAGMGMMGGHQMDSKLMGRMLQLRGDMLKAVGDVLIKHGQAMQAEP